MLDLTFRQQLWLSIIDKLALGSVLVGIGYLANRRLESQKSRQALRARMAEVRMPKIAEEIERFTTETRDAEAFLRRAWSEAESLVRHHHALLAKLQSGLSEQQAQETAFLLARTPSELDVAFFGLLGRDQKTVDALADRLQSAWKKMLDAHFWLGTELLDILNRQYLDWWYRLASPELALEWLRSTPSLPSRAVVSRTFWGRLRAWYTTRRDRRALERLGFSTARVHTDISRMIDHVS